MKYFNFIKRDISFNSIIYNRVFLYIVLFSSIINMTAYGLLGDIITPLIFVLISVITAYYNKNMLVILLTSLVFSNIVKYGNKLAINMEGFSEGLNEPDEDAPINESATDTKPTINNKTSTTGNNTKDVGMDENSDSIKKFKIMKEEMDKLIVTLEDKINIVNNELTDLQEKIKIKAKQNGVTIK